MQDAPHPINPHPTNTDPINAELVRALVAEQFPQWAHLPVTAVERQGWDNRSFCLGDEFMVRLPSGDGYVAGLLGEDEVLRQLRGHLPVALPEPVAQGAPSDLFGRPWLVRRHLAGTTPDRVDDLDLGGFARDLASALVALREAPTRGARWAGDVTQFRGCHPGVWGSQMQAMLADHPLDFDRDRAREIWRTAMGSVWQGEPVWFHGDLAVGNLLVHDGRLSAFIDVGQTGVGDPACDLTIAWTLFRGGDRQAFVEALGEQGRDPELWERARGWALWKALLSTRNPDDGLFAVHAAALPEILAAGETGAWPPALTT